MLYSDYCIFWRTFPITLIFTKLHGLIIFIVNDITIIILTSIANCLWAVLSLCANWKNHLYIQEHMILQIVTKIDYSILKFHSITNNTLYLTILEKYSWGSPNVNSTIVDDAFCRNSALSGTLNAKWWIRISTALLQGFPIYKWKTNLSLQSIWKFFNFIFLRRINLILVCLRVPSNVLWSAVHAL